MFINLPNLFTLNMYAFKLMVSILYGAAIINMFASLFSLQEENDFFKFISSILKPINSALIPEKSSAMMFSFGRLLTIVMIGLFNY